MIINDRYTHKVIDVQIENTDKPNDHYVIEVYEYPNQKPQYKIVQSTKEGVPFFGKDILYYDTYDDAVAYLESLEKKPI